MAEQNPINTLTPDQTFCASCGCLRTGRVRGWHSVLVIDENITFYLCPDCFSRPAAPEDD